MKQVTLSRRIDQLEAVPSKARPLRIRGGLRGDLLSQQSRATIITKAGHMSSHERDATESLSVFLLRLSKLPGTLSLGGLPPLPGTQFVNPGDTSCP
ncbi:hypothetical protein SAMN05444161_3890 [Rhizobiales bacterium GAS191]|nr:hypothetical protein SAMN05444161_3890 [Rhizobiales bacterium GAS191]